MADQYTAGGGSEVDRLRGIIKELDQKHLRALQQRNALQARIDRALELWECKAYNPLADDCEGQSNACDDPGCECRDRSLWCSACRMRAALTGDDE